MAAHLALGSLLSLVFHASAAWSNTNSQDNTNWADDLSEWVPSWLKELDFDPESWSEKLGVPKWQEELQKKICKCDNVEDAKCNMGEVARHKIQLLEKLEREYAAKIDLKAQLNDLKTQLRTSELKNDELVNSSIGLLAQLDSAKEELKEAKEEHERLLAQLDSTKQELKEASVGTPIYLQICPIIMLVLIWCFAAFQQKTIDTQKMELDEVTKDLKATKKEFDSELGGMLKVSDFSGHLGEEFSFHISDDIVDQWKTRSIKIQCPGVNQNDVRIAIVANGCEVTIERQTSRGVEAVRWQKRFQFRPSEGTFDFNDDKALLENGFLTLVFDVRDCQGRIFLLPPPRFPISDMKGSRQWPDNGCEQSEQNCNSEVAEELQQDVPVELQPATTPAVVKTECNDTCAFQDSAQMSPQATQNTDGTQFGTTPENSGLIMSHEAPEEVADEEDPDASDSDSTLDGFEHVHVCA